MNGNRFILDTNAIIALLKGNTELLNSLKRISWVGISIVSYMEFLVFPDLSSEDKALFNTFVQRVNVIDLEFSNKQLLDTVISNRIKYGIKLPDSIIISTAIINNAKLVTADKQILSIPNIETVSFTP